MGVGLMEPFMEFGEGPQPVFTLEEKGLGVGMGATGGLQVKECGGQSHLIGNPVVDLPDQEVLLMQLVFMSLGILQCRAFPSAVFKAQDSQGPHEE